MNACHCRKWRKKIKPTQAFLSRLKLLYKFFVELLTLFGKAGAIEGDALQNFHQRIDLAFGGVKLINDDDFLVFQNTISRLEITFLITKRIIRLRDHVLQLCQEWYGVFNHGHLVVSCPKDKKNLVSWSPDYRRKIIPGTSCAVGCKL